MTKLNKIDVFAGLFVILIGGLAILESLKFQMGTAQNMGPGYFPFYIGVFLLLLGGGIIMEARKLGGDAREAGQLPKARSVLLILAAVVVYALMIERFGLVPATTAAVFLGVLADSHTSMTQKLVLTVVVPLVCVLIFKLGLGMTVDIVRWRP